MQEIYLTFRKDLFKWVYWKCRNKQLAKDICQDTWYKVIKNWDLYKEKPDASLKTWIFTIAKNLVIDHFKSKRRPLYKNSLDIICEKDFDKIQYESTDWSTSDYHQKWFITEWLKKLDPVYQKIYFYKFVEKKPIKWIIKELNINTDEYRWKLNTLYSLTKDIQPVLNKINDLDFI